MNAVEWIRLCVWSILITSAPASIGAGFAYITNQGSPPDNSTVTVIDTTNDTVVDTVTVGAQPQGVAISPDGSKVYVTSTVSNTVSVIDTSTNTVTKTINAGIAPIGIAITPDGSRVYVANAGNGTVSVIDTNTDDIIATINLSGNPALIITAPDGSKLYASIYDRSAVAIINSSDNSVTSVSVGTFPHALAVTPNGEKVYVVNINSHNISLIDTQNSNSVSTISVGSGPLAYGAAISADGAKLYVTSLSGNTVTVINTVDHSSSSFGLTGGPTGIGLAPDGSKIYVAKLVAGQVDVLDARDNSLIKTLTAGVFPTAFGAFITPETCAISGARTMGQGEWKNQGTVLANLYSTTFNSLGGLKIGNASRGVVLTNVASVSAFLPNAGTPQILPNTLETTNPTRTSLKNTLAGQAVAAALNLAYNESRGLRNAVIQSGPYKGITAAQLLSAANTALGGGAAKSTLSDLTTALEALNESYKGGVASGFVCAGS